MAKSICITGSGIICAIGTDKESVLNSLQKKQSGIGTIQYLQSDHKELPVGEVKMSNEELKTLNYRQQLEYNYRLNNPSKIKQDYWSLNHQERLI